MPLTRLSLAVAFVLLTGCIVWAHTIELFYMSGVLHVLDVFWGKLVLLDFVASLVLLGLWMAMLLPQNVRLTHGLLWMLGVIVLGAPIALLYFLLRSRHGSSAQEIFLGRQP